MTNDQLLRACYLCRQLDDKEMASLAAIASFRKARKGEVMFIEGDTAVGFYVLLTGRVRIYKASPEGKEYTLHQIAPGQMFAEAAIFRGTTYPANGAAMADSTVAFFPKDRFVDLLARSPQMSLKMIGALSAFIREFNEKVEDLSLKEVPARLAAYLLKLSRKKGRTFQLDITKTELAHSLGTISATLSRNLKKLSDIGAIEVTGKNITILDAKLLESVHDGEKI